MKRRALLLVAVAGCGKSSGSTATPSVTEPLVVRDAQAAGSNAPLFGKKPACPAADKIVLIEPLYDAADEAAPPVGWNLPLAAMPAPAGAVTAPITADEAKAAGVASVPKTVWIVRAGQPLCRGRVTDLTRNLDDAPGSMSIDARIEGCAPPARDEAGPWFALAVDNEPKGCDFETPKVIAERLGEADGETWVRPTKQTPIPAAITPPPRACTAPACEALWSVRAAVVGGKPLAYEATFTWAHPDAALALCTIAHDDDHALYAIGKTGAAKKLDEVGAWQRLAGVFYDATGPRALVTTSRGTYTVRPFAADGTGAPITRAWYVPSDDEAGTWSLAQYCGD
ncbi:MAG TPA: hypothetical protein VL463_36055 [Kofleriaceae bacterium]|nr:hypothetical protein [Kofleriaceae bacterium]